MREALSESEQSVYYSSWHYSAFHMAISVPKYQTLDALYRHFSLTGKQGAEIVAFLVRTGLAQTDGTKVVPGTSWIHLGKESPLAPKNHTNWRLQALRTLDYPDESDLHYTSGISISRDDMPKVKSILVRALDQIRDVIAGTTRKPPAAY